MPRARSRSASSRRFTATTTATALAGLSLVVVGGPAITPPARVPAPATATAVVVAASRDVPQDATAGQLQPMATVAGAQLVVPAIDPVAVGFHQGGAAHLALTPTGEHVVMASRNRSTAPTTAVDVAVGDDRTVTAPVTGTVTQVAEYSLYGRIPDVLVTIAPDGADVAVRMMHLTDVTIQPGQRVDAGQPIATARPLPMGSQIDRHHDHPAGPHVHLDVSAR